MSDISGVELGANDVNFKAPDPSADNSPSRIGPEQSPLGRTDGNNQNPALREIAGSKSRFDPEQIRRTLSMEVPVSELPATDVVARQLDRNQEDILRKAPSASRQQVALSLAVRLKGVGFYQRISEQAMFGPKDYERYDDPAILTQRLPEIRRGLDDAVKRIMENRPTARIIRENGWLYVDQGKHNTDYRIYLSPDPGSIGKVFSALALEIPENVRYQMKTFDNPTHGQDVSRLDKIIIYVSDGDLDTVLTALGRVYDSNQQSFAGRPAPGGGKIVPAEGVSITAQSDKEVNGNKVTGTHEAASAIEERLPEIARKIARKGFVKHKDATSASLSDEGRFFWSMMELDQDRIARNMYAGKESLSEDQRRGLAEVYARILFTAAMYGFSEGRPISVSVIKQSFLKAIQGRVHLRQSQLQYLLTERLSPFEIDSVQTTVSDTLERTGLAIAFNNGLEKSQSAGATFRKLVS